MKKLIFLLLSLATCTVFSMAQDGEGIQFLHDKSWKEVLAEAKKSEKMVFLDAYTTWCGPCKYMSKNVFPQKEVGEFYNKHFVSVKIDMEKGEGLTLAEQYKIIAYPTLLIIDADGNVVHRKAGGMEGADFIEFGKEATDPSRALSALDKKYAEGDRSGEFLKNYTKARYHAADGSHNKIMDEYLATQDDWGTQENMQFILDFVSSADTKAFEYLAQNKTKFAAAFGQPKVTQVMQSMIYNLIYAKESRTIDEIEAIFKKYYPEKAEMMTANYKMSYYRQRGDREGYAKAAVERFDNYPVENYGELNETAWTFFQVIEDKALLEKALGWAKQSVKMRKSYENVDTVAHLYYKLGDMKKAKCQAKKAIRLAKKSKDDYAVTQELLNKIKAAK